MAITVRQATLADLDAFRFVGFSTCPVTYGPFAGPGFVVRQLDRWWSPERLAGPLERGDCLIAGQGDTVLGVSEIGDYNGDLVMWKLYVLPGSQRQGVGTMLLEAVKRIAAERDRVLVTEYVAGNTRAGEFYRSQGFEDFAAPAGPLDSSWLRYPKQLSSA